MTAETDVRQVSDHFYAALSSMLRGDPEPMMEAWSHGPDVSTMHPLGEREIGWSEVEGPWRGVASMCSAGHVSLKDQVVVAQGNLAYETGYEVGEGTLAGRIFNFHHRVTNIYRLEDGKWKIVHHHADKVPEMEEFVAGLQK
jgi:ketosteroid isomerase-like protein